MGTHIFNNLNTKTMQNALQSNVMTTCKEHKNDLLFQKKSVVIVRQKMLKTVVF